MLTAAEVAKRAGLPRPTLLWWVRRGWLKAAVHPGRHWAAVLFTPAQSAEAVRRARKVRRLRAEITKTLRGKTLRGKA